MKSRIYLILILVALGCAVETNAQQNIQFSQYVFNPLFINSAYAGYRGDTYVSGIYRQQWAGLPGSPVTFGASVDWLVPGRDERMGFSAKLMSDKLGPQQTLYASGGYAYRIPMDATGAKRLCLGFGLGITQYRMDGTQLKAVDVNDQAVPVNNETKLVPDANLGVYYYTPDWYVSLAVNDLLAPRTLDVRYSWNQYTFRTMQRSQHLYLGAGCLLNLSDNVKIKPSFMWKEDFKGPSNIDINAFVLLNEVLWVGSSYRRGVKIWNKDNLQSDLEQKDAVALIAEVNATPTIRIGYAYDITISKLSPYQNGTHEISVGLRFLNKKSVREISPRYF